MEPENLFRKSALMAALEILQRPAIKLKIYEYVKDSDDEDWKQVEKIQAIALDELTEAYNLPESIKEDINWAFDPLSDQIISQITSYKQLGCFHDKILDDFIWDSNGTINNLETCKKIFERDIDYDMKIRLACVYCFEDKLEDLLLTKDGYWTRQIDDILFYDKSNHNYNNTLIRYWFEQLRKKITKKEINITVTDREALTHSILLCNEVATQYFFEKLTPEDKDFIMNHYILDMFEQVIFPCQAASKVQRNEMLFYLIKQYKTEDLRALCLRSRSHLTETILECFLSFPYRHYFLLYEKVLLPIITCEEAFYYLLLEVSYDFYLDPELYEVIYSKIWNEYCSKYEFIIHLLFKDGENEGLIRNLLYAEEYDFILSIIKHCRDVDKYFFFWKYTKAFVDELIFYENEDIFKDIAARCLLNKDEVINFRDDWNDGFFKNKEALSECNKSEDGECNQRIECQVQNIIEILLESFDSGPSGIKVE